MNIWSKLITAIRGGVNEAGEALVDTQALRILDQEVRDAAEELKQSKASLAEIIAYQKVAEEKAAHLNEKVKEHEAYAVQALEKSDESLALEVAEKIAIIENQLSDEKVLVNGYKESADKIRIAIQQAESNIKHLKQQVDTVKANENVQRAQEAVATRYSGSQSKMRTAMDSLERIKEKQALKDAQLKAESELATEDNLSADLAAKLENAGIKTGSKKTAQDILERLKNKNV